MLILFNFNTITLTNVTFTEKAEKALQKYSELHIQKTQLKYIDRANQILFTMATKSLSAVDVVYESSCFKALGKHFQIFSYQIFIMEFLKF